MTFNEEFSVEISQVLMRIKANDLSDVDGKLKSNCALKSRCSFHDVVLARDEREEIEIDKRGNLREKVTREADLFVKNRVENCEKSVDGERFRTKLHVHLF